MIAPKLRRWMGLAAALIFLAPLLAHAGLTKDIEYAQPDGVSVKLDACVPEGAGPFPAAILVHGGGWSGGDKATEIDPLFAPLTKAGIAWFSINYRLAPQYKYPACIEDAEAAVRWVKAHAKEYNIDPDKIVLIGESAGGHIVDTVAVRATKDRPETRVAAVVAFYAPCDNVSDSIRRKGPSPSMQNLLGVPAEKVDADGKLSDATTGALYNASPINFVHKDLPPYLLVHGTADTSVPYEQSLRWQAKLKELGVPCDLITIKGGPHVMGRWETIDPTYKDQTVAWLVKTLGLKPVTSAPTPAKPAATAASASASAKST